jgi:Ca-activated chloride channel family protein
MAVLRGAISALALCLGLLLLAAGPPALAQTTGVIKGVTLDDGGLPIPGVQVTIDAEVLNGAQQEATDVDGRFEFPDLPPGVYSLTAERSGFTTTRREDLQVLIGRDTVLTIELVFSGGGEEIVVCEESSRRPLLTREFLQRVPEGRTYQSAVTTVPGVIGGGNPNVGNPPEDYGGEHYTDYGVNGWVSTDEDALSTFAVDVDTASYAVARRKLREGTLPPPSSVRVEEFVNYFRYAYGGPDDAAAPFAVNLEAAPHPTHPDRHLLRVGLQGRQPEFVEDRPVHLTFLVDSSGSMRSPDKMGLLKQSLHLLVDRLSDDDTVALATYAGGVREVLPPTGAANRRVLHAAIDSLDAGGSTAMEGGLQLAYRLADAARIEGHESRVIVLSDGDANVGATSHEEILESIREYAGRGITLTTVGFGAGNYKDTMMEQLANQGDGNYSYIDGIEEAGKVFGADLEGTLEVIARDVKIQVAFNPEAVRSYRLVGYENRDIADEDFRDDAVDAGEIGAGHQVTAIYEVALAEGWRGAGELAVVRIRNKQPGAEEPAVEWEVGFPASQVREELAGTTDSFRLAAGVALFAELLRGSAEVEGLTYADAYRLIHSAHDPSQALQTQLLELVEEAACLSGEEVALR